MDELVFLETSPFQKWVRKNHLRSAVTKLCEELAANPDAGDVIPGSGGIRKIRMAGAGRGKRGGFRVVYALFLNRTVAALLAGYDKVEKSDLTADEIKAIRMAAELVEAELRKGAGDEED